MGGIQAVAHSYSQVAVAHSKPLRFYLTQATLTGDVGRKTHLQPRLRGQEQNLREKHLLTFNHQQHQPTFTNGRTPDGLLNQ